MLVLVLFSLFFLVRNITWLNQFKRSFAQELSKLKTIYQIQYLQPVIANLDLKGRFQQFSTLCFVL